MKEVFMSELTETSTTARDNVGDVRFENGKYYRYVKNNHSAEFGVGDVPVYDVSLAGKYHEAIEIAATATLARTAGVIVTAIPAASYGWILIEGAVDLVTISSVAHVVGDKINSVNASLIGLKAAVGSGTSGREGDIVITNAATSAIPTAYVRLLTA